MKHLPKRRLAASLLYLVCVAVAGNAEARAPFDPRLRAELQQAGDTPVLAWIRFTDKGTAEKVRPAESLVSARSLHRRAKVRSPQQLVDATDLPVNAAYVQSVAQQVERVRQHSKWFNAVSVVATRAQLENVAALPCVRSVESLTRYRRAAGAPTSPGEIQLETPPQSPAPGARPAPPRGAKPGPPQRQSLDYGRAVPQVAIMGVPALHDQGLNGQGVWIGHFDDGYRLLSHEAFQSIQIVAGYDFVDHDPDPAPPLADPNFGSHGISTLSVIGGYAPGKLIGTAYAASFVLARTEDDGSETPLEEDNWIAAIEWADSLGIDVATTSLGYLAFDLHDPPYTNHTWQDLDGHTTLMTRAADLAVGRGIVLFNAAGNDGLNTQHNTLLVPSDGDSVIAVGGVLPDSTRYPTSSVGPTAGANPRIKPDVMALGGAVWIAATGSVTHFAQSAGTSFACPLAAGVAALLLQAQPNATPMQIRDAMRSTATHAATPDNLYGWGIVDAPAALAHLRTAVQAASWTDVKGRFR